MRRFFNEIFVTCDLLKTPILYSPIGNINFKKAGKLSGKIDRHIGRKPESD